MELIKYVIFFVGILVAVCSGLPASKKDEVEAVTPVKTYGDQPIVDTGVFSGWDSPFSSNPFGGLFDSLEGIMERMRQQVASLLNRSIFSQGDNSTEDFSPFPGLEHAPFPILGGVDLSKGNTTSVTKVIDGHKVIINETEYVNEDDFGGTFFKVRIVDVKPDSSEQTTEKEAEAVPENTTEKDREDIADSIENEITKSKEAEVVDKSSTAGNISLDDNLQNSHTSEFQNIETFDEVASFENIDEMPSAFSNHNAIESTENQISTNREWSTEDGSDTTNPKWSYIDPIESVDTNSIESKEVGKEYEKQIPIDLSRDIYVNEIMAKNGGPVNPDAEVFIVEDIKKLSPFERIIDPR